MILSQLSSCATAINTHPRITYNRDEKRERRRKEKRCEMVFPVYGAQQVTMPLDQISTVSSPISVRSLSPTMADHAAHLMFTPSTDCDVIAPALRQCLRYLSSRKCC